MGGLGRAPERDPPGQRQLGFASPYRLDGGWVCDGSVITGATAHGPRWQLTNWPDRRRGVWATRWVVILACGSLAHAAVSPVVR
jgi:hypothetical protein